MDGKFLTPAQASDLLKTSYGISYSTHTMARHRSEGGGPVYRKINHRVYYTQYDLRDWVVERATPLSNTLGGAK